VNPWLQLLGSAAVGAVLVAIIGGLFSKRKLSAEATDIITKAASGVVERLEAENARVIASNTLLSGKVEAQQIQVDQVQRAQRAQGEALAIHAFWDRQAVEALREHGIDLPPPPPLPTHPGS
jgi:hypothetical protein